MPDGVITSNLLISYTKCPLKAYSLYRGEVIVPNHPYSVMVEQNKNIVQQRYFETVSVINESGQVLDSRYFPNDKLTIPNAKLIYEKYEAECGLLRVSKDSSNGRSFCYEPTIFSGLYSVEDDNKIELIFIALVLAKLQSGVPSRGAIVTRDGKVHYVNIKSEDLKSLNKSLKSLELCLLSSSAPALILIKHCVYCSYNAICKSRAITDDNLSLLNGISTASAVAKYNGKGIFTVKQLSYLYRPRRSRKNNTEIANKHRPELQALALRASKTYVQVLPVLNRTRTEIFIDIEGVPDQDLYYLIGLLICREGVIEYKSIWADSSEDRTKMLEQVNSIVSSYDVSEVVLYHYGSYESKALAKLIRECGEDRLGLKDKLVNINTSIFGKIYFPVLSNSLKVLGKYLGASWTSSEASGLQSIVWRNAWKIRTTTLIRSYC